MEKLLTTREMAAVIGASESSLRRWTNSGVIGTSRTTGGHRRIPLSEAIRFIRETRATVLRPDLLGLPAAGSVARARADDDVYRALMDGDADRARGAVVGMYLGGTAVASLFDQHLQPALHRIGELWEHDPRGILIEHRAIDVCLQTIAKLRELLPPAPETGPVAMGGAPADDAYLLPSMMAATVVADAGYRDVNLGPRTPVEMIGPEAEARGASLVWLSVSEVEDRDRLLAGVRALADRLAGRNVPLVMGGRRAAELALPGARNVHVLKSMTELSAFARAARVA